MKVKVYKGQAIAGVMAEVRRDLGPDAVILSRTQRRGEVEVTAAIEALPHPVERRAGGQIAREADLERRLREDLLGAMKTETLRARSRRQPASEHTPHAPGHEMPTHHADHRDGGWVRTGTMGIVTRRIKAPGAIATEKTPPHPRADLHAVPHEMSKPAEKKPEPRAPGRIESALSFHGLPRQLAEDLARTAAMMDTDDETSALACAIDARFSLDPVPAMPSRPVMLIGPPGVGKTVTAAKLAARAVLSGRGVDIISTDSLRAGAREQMESFTSILKEDLVSVSRPDELHAVLAAAREGDHPRPSIIDTPGTNPYSTSEIEDLKGFVTAFDIEPVLVLAAGGDPAELVDIAHVFATLGVHRMIATRIDAVRRLGGILAAADGANLSLAQFSMTPYLARGLSTMNPVSLARLLLQERARKTSEPSLKNGTRRS